MIATVPRQLDGVGPLFGRDVSRPLRAHLRRQRCAGSFLTFFQPTNAARNVSSEIGAAATIAGAIGVSIGSPALRRSIARKALTVGFENSGTKLPERAALAVQVNLERDRDRIRRSWALASSPRSRQQLNCK
jgi:hypothetical protein